MQDREANEEGTLVVNLKVMVSKAEHISQVVFSRCHM